MAQFWTPLHAQIHRTIRYRKLLQENQSIVIAVSGGQDSLCLAQLLLDLRSRIAIIIGALIPKQTPNMSPP